MAGLYFLLPTLLAVLFSFLVVRAGAIAFMMTGLDQKRARFQALSAFTGTGFTTREAERVVNHEVRRKIATWLMVLGNAGIVTVIVTVTSSMVTSRGYSVPVNLIVLLLGIYLIYRLMGHTGLMRRWERFMEDRLQRYRDFEEEATEDLLRLIEGYGLVRLIVSAQSPLISETLSEQRLPEKNVLVLGIERKNAWIPVPKADEPILEGDRVIVYGPLKALRDLPIRRQTRVDGESG
jgi:hypothetical protein